MPENARLSGSLDEINLGFEERDATPRLLMKLGIQLRLAGLSLSNTVSILEVFGVHRVRSTVHNWAHKAELQPEGGRRPNHETACRRYGFEFRYERHGDRNSNECIFREVKQNIFFLNCFSNAEAETADEWLNSFAFTWNPLM